MRENGEKDIPRALPCSAVVDIGAPAMAQMHLSTSPPMRLLYSSLAYAVSFLDNSSSKPLLRHGTAVIVVYSAFKPLYRMSAGRWLWAYVTLRTLTRDRVARACWRPRHDVIFRENVLLYLFGRGSSPVLVG